MRSESEVRWVRAKNRVGQSHVVTDWHAILPGIGDLNLPPGTVCSTGLVGSLQFAGDGEVRTLDGRRHEVCAVVVKNWLAEIDPSPGPRIPDPAPTEFAPPKNRYTEQRDRKR